MGAANVGAANVGAVEVGLAKVGLAKVGLAKVGPPRQPRLCGPLSLFPAVVHHDPRLLRDLGPALEFRLGKRLELRGVS